MRRYNKTQKVWAIVLTLVMVLGMLPPMTVTAVGEDAVNRVADPSTLNEYQELFLDPDTIGVELTTENAGGIWTDKSVFAANNVPGELTGAVSELGSTIPMEDTGDNFLVALSAIASNKEIVGYSTRPTDTMLVLDLSGSMQGSTSTMVTAANKAIGDLLALNEHNRVGVVLFSGNSQTGNSNTSTATVLMPLGRYTTTSYTGNGSNRAPQYIRSNNSEQVSVASGVSPRTGLGSSKNTVGGTYTQNGIYKAMNELVDAEDKVIPDGSLQAGTTRLPIMVLMTDGEPSAATKNYTNVGTSDVGNGSTGTSTAHDMAFLTQLTMAYAKREIDTAYATESLVYTLGYSVDSNNYARSVMDPAAYTTDRIDELWDTFNNTRAGRTFNVNDRGTNESVTKHTDAAGKYAKELKDYRYYADEYFPASRQSDLTAAFQSIVDEIILQSKYYPTYVEKDHDHDGYITFTDKIGGYMEVTDVHGIVIGDTLYSGALLARTFENSNALGTVEKPTELGNNLVWSVQERLGIADTAIARQLLQNAYTYGQLSYTSDTNFSNYIGWYSDANGNYLDFWYEGITSEPPTGATHIVKSYGMLGNTDAAHGIAASDMMYASIRVAQEIGDQDGDGIPGETLLTWQIPASLVPTVTYKVNVIANASGEITGVNSVELENANVKPIRLLYEVALRENIHEWNITEEVSDGYKTSTTNKDAGYVFYTNQWKKEDGTVDTTRNTYSHFEPSLQNEWYYYTEDAIIYTNTNGTEYTGAAAPSTSGTYYRAYQVFEKLETGAYRMHTHYEQISAESLTKAEKSGNNWVIPKGTVFRFWDPFQESKTANATNTHAYSEYPTITYDDARGHYYALDVLGNNGKITVTPSAGIKVTKTIDELVDGASNTFTFVISGGSGEATLVRLNAEGEEASREALTFADGKAEFALSADETVYIIGLADGVTYTIAEKGNDHYNVSSVTVNGTAVTGTAAQITATSQSIQSAAFVNSPKGYGDLYISKNIESDHTIPDTILAQDFQILVDVGTELAGEELTVKMTDMADPTKDITSVVTVDAEGCFVLTLRNTQTAKILALPENTVVTVTEILTGEQETYFTYTVKSRDYSGAEEEADGIVTIHKDLRATASVINEYNPASVELNVDFNGTKNFNAEKMTEDAEFTFRLQQHVDGAWADVDTASVIIPAGTKDAAERFNFDSLELTFDQVGTYSYQILEDKGDNADITYDRSIYTFTVVVTDNDGKLEAKIVANVESGDEANFGVAQNTDGDWSVTAVFNNEYHTAATDIDIQKIIVDNADAGKSGQGFVMESYNASVTDGVWTLGSFIRSATTDAEGEARLVRNYDNSDFADGETTKTYHFIIKEKNSGLTGWAYDNTHYLVTVALTRAVGTEGTENITADFAIHKGVPAEDGSFTAGEVVVESGNAATITFTNTFDPADAPVDLNIVPTVVKHLEGRDLVAGEFTFHIYNDGDRQIALATGTNDAAGNVKFDKNLTFGKVGTYKLDVVEEKGSLGGVTYDETVYDMVVIVTEEDGVLSAEYYFEDSTTKTANFYNDYEAADTEIVLSGTKTLTGRPLVNAEFRFSLTEVTDETGTTAKDGGVVLITNNDSDDNDDGTTQFAFPAITYTDTGVYYYLVEEVNAGSTILGVTYSTAKYVVKVTVTDPGNGQLVATSEVVGSDAVAFTNTYVPQSTSTNLHSSKELTGRVMADGEFQFSLTEKTDNTYATDKSGGVSQTVKNTENGDIAFDTLHFNAAGDYYYVVEEVKGSAGGVTYDETKYQIHISVVDNHKGSLVATTTIVRVTDEGATQVEAIIFHNDYTIDGDGVVELSGQKIYNKELSGGEFEFALLDSEGNLIDTAQNAADGSFVFSKLNYTEADVGQVYTYYVEEVLPVVEGVEQSVYQGITYDTTVYTVVVTIVDDGEGGIDVTHTVNGAGVPIIFTNEYAVTGHDTVVLGGTKHVSGDRTAMTAGEYEFGLYEGNTQLQKVAVNVDGTFTFEALAYDKDAIREEPYTYTIKEIIPADTKGVTYDTKEYTVLVYVRDNGAGGVEASYTIDGSAYTQVVFTNTYTHKSVDYTLEAVKAYTKPLKGDDFTFTLSGAGFETQTKKNDATGKVVFDKLTFTDDGVYTFTVTEVDKLLGFINYSKEVYTVKITVHDNGIGQLVVTDVTVTDSNGNKATELLFENVYVLDGEAQVTLHGTKTLTGFRTQLQDKEFAFGLYDSENNLLQTVYNNTQGSFMFNTLVFDESYVGQTLTYTVKEILPVVNGQEVTEHEGRTYDTTVYTVVIQVKDNEKGGVVIDYTINGAENTPITFTNKYDVKPAEVQLEGVKSYNRPLNGNDFTFRLTGEGQDQIKKNDADGKIVFDEISFTKVGTYHYEIAEIEKLLGFITYSDKINEVQVVVTDNNKGQLEATVTINDQTNGQIAFENIYNLTGEAEVTLEATKVYNQDLEGDDFTFVLMDADRNVLQTKTNAADGKVRFDKLTFGVTDLGLHTYYVEEVLPKDEHGHEVSSLEGITYDTHTYTVLVNVFDNGAGKVATSYTVDMEEDKDMVFTNTYTVDGHDTVELKGTKTMTGDRGSVVAGEFAFGLYYADGTKVLDKDNNHITATNDASGNFAFPTLYYNETHLGKHSYLIKEIVPATNPTDGITYDTTVYEVEIHVVDNTLGTVDASYTINGSAHTPIAFTNSYKHDPVDHVLEATKIYEKGLKGDDFTFTLTGEGFETQTKKNDADGKVVFDKLTFTDNGVYTFTVTETDKILGFINYSSEVYTVKVTVTDNGKGKLFVEKVEVTDSKGDKATDMVFVNLYEITGTDEIVLSGSKGITGDRTAVKENEFTFQLLNKSGVLVEEVKNDVSGNFSFTALTFGKEDIGQDISFLVKEKAGNTGGMTYDDTVYTVKVKVVDDNRGGVIASYQIVDAENLAFTNQYISKDVKVRLEGTKVYDKPLKGDDFTFVLKNDEGKVLQTKKNDADGKIVFDDLVFGETGKYTYTIAETEKLLGFIQYSSATYEVVIDVTDPHTGFLAANVTVTGGADNGKIEFVNTYILDGEDYVDLYAQKNFNLPLQGDDFKFGLYNDKGELLQVATNKADGSVIFNTLSFDEQDVGKTFTYTVREILPLDEHGHELNVHYGIVYDTTVYTVEVAVSDDGTGGVDAAYTVNGGDNQMVFNNTYTVTGLDELNLEGVKYITGDRTELLEGEVYTFELLDDDGNLVQSATSDADGKFTFTGIHFDADDIPGAPYFYTVQEKVPSGDKKGVNYDDTVYTVEIYVVDNGKGGVEVSHAVNGHDHDNLIFTNSYTAEDVTVDLVGTKSYDKGLKGDDFTFLLEGEIDGVKVKQEKKNDADGNIFFDTLTFTQEGIYTFQVVETEKLLGFIQYSDAKYEVVITVTDNDHGELEAEVLVNTVKDGKIEFTNQYQYLDAEDEITITGTKTLTGFRTQTKAGEFTFGLYKGEELVEEVTNAADGSFSFATVKYGVDDIGKHTYTVKEIIPEGTVDGKLKGYTYDATEFTVTVDVVDDNKGNIVATKTITGADAIVFTNKYEVKAAEVTLKGTKTYDKPLAGDDFTFVLEGEIDGVKVEQEKKNDKNGDIFFDTLTFVKVGTYEFAVKEKAEVLGFIQYAKEVYKVQITVTDNGEGQLIAAISVNDKADGKMEFVNDYTLVDADNELTITGTKTLVGRDLTAGEFSFGLYDDKGALLETVTNDASGNFAFTKLVYQIKENESATYTYTVKEIAGSDPSVTYDKTVYTVVVEVKDDNKGGVELTSTVNGTADGVITFTNTYTEPADVLAKIYIQKNVVNKTEPGIGLKDFTFVLSDGTSTVEAKSDENGKTGFQITFGADDIGKTYEFQVSEKKGSTPGMTYDATVHTVTVKVSQNADGTLALTINDKAADSVSLSFTNTYEEPGTPVTGDSFPVMLLGALMLLSAAGVVVVLLNKDKKRGKYSA